MTRPFERVFSGPPIERFRAPPRRRTLDRSAGARSRKGGAFNEQKSNKRARDRLTPPRPIRARTVNVPAGCESKFLAKSL